MHWNSSLEPAPLPAGGLVPVKNADERLGYIHLIQFDWVQEIIRDISKAAQQETEEAYGVDAAQDSRGGGVSPSVGNEQRGSWFRWIHLPMWVEGRI